MDIERVFLGDTECPSDEIEYYLVWRTSEGLVDFLEPIAHYRINGKSDLGMTNRDDIGKTVRLLKVSKSGLYIVVDGDDKVTQLPKRNLDLCECVN